MTEIGLFLVGLLAFVSLLIVMGIVADSWDARERRDARRRNPKGWRE